MNIPKINNLSDYIYNKAEKLTRGTPLTVTGWALLLILLAVPFLLGCSYVGYTFNTQLIELQSKTNGLEYSSNYKQLHKYENLNKTEEHKNGN